VIPVFKVLTVILPGAVLFIASGAIMIEAWRHVAYERDVVLASGVLNILNGIIYLVDFGFTFHRYR
jgi:hypothetical protein